MHFASMSLGIFDFLLEWIANFVGTIIGFIFQIIMEVVNRLIYTTVTQILTIVDFIQTLFRKLAGLDMYWVVENGQTSEREGDILISLFTNNTVLQVLLALSLVAVAMVIIAAVIQMIRTEFTTEGSKNSKAGIIGQAIKSLMMFFLVPVLCFGGIFLSNALLGAIDTATSLGANQSMASQIFVSGASSANKARTNSNYISANEKMLKDNGLFVTGNIEATALNIDNAFRGNIELKNLSGDAAAGLDAFVTTIIGVIFQSFTVGPFGAFVFSGGTIVMGEASLNRANYANISVVTNFYNIGNMNMIILIGGSLVAAYIMIITSFGLIMRLFKATVLFMISPPLIAISPLDGGAAFKDWRTAFIGQVLSGYGAIVGLNLLFIILPVVNNINLFGGIISGSAGSGFNILNDITHLFFTIVALYMVKDLIGMISKFIKADDATASGDAMAKKAGGTALSIAGAAATGGLALAGKAAGALGGNSKFGGMAKKLGNASANSFSGILGSAKGKAAKMLNTYAGTHLNDKESVNDRYEEEEKRDKAAKKRAKTGAFDLADMHRVSEKDYYADPDTMTRGPNLGFGSYKSKAEAYEEREGKISYQKSAAESASATIKANAATIEASNAKLSTLDKEEKEQLSYRNRMQLTKEALATSQNVDTDSESDVASAISELNNTLRNGDVENAQTQQYISRQVGLLQEIANLLANPESDPGGSKLLNAQLQYKENKDVFDYNKADKDLNDRGLASADKIKDLRSAQEAEKQKKLDLSIESAVYSKIEGNVNINKDNLKDVIRSEMTAALKKNGITDTNKIDSMTDKAVKELSEKMEQVLNKHANE